MSLVREKPLTGAFSWRVFSVFQGWHDGQSVFETVALAGQQAWAVLFLVERLAELESWVPLY